MRIPTTLRLPRSRLMAVLVLLVSVTLCAAGVRASDNILQSQKVSGAVGEQIAVNGGWIRVDDVRVGQILAQNDKVLGRTDGLYVVLTITQAATGADSGRFSEAAVLTRDRTYDRWTGTSPSPVTGFTDSAQSAFEVDPSQIDDLTLTLEPGDFVSRYTQFVAVPLGITAANAAEWRTAGRGRLLDLADDPDPVALR